MSNNWFVAPHDYGQGRWFGAQVDRQTPQRTYYGVIKPADHHRARPEQAYIETDKIVASGLTEEVAKEACRLRNAAVASRDSQLAAHRAAVQKLVDDQCDAILALIPTANLKNQRHL